MWVAENSLQIGHKCIPSSSEAVKENYFAASIAFSKSQPAKSFWVVWRLVVPGMMAGLLEHLAESCEHFAWHIEDKVAWLHSAIDITVVATPA